MKKSIPELARMSAVDVDRQRDVMEIYDDYAGKRKKIAPSDLIPDVGRIINTDGQGNTLFIGSVDPVMHFSPVDGDVWIESAP